MHETGSNGLKFLEPVRSHDALALDVHFGTQVGDNARVRMMRGEQVVYDFSHLRTARLACRLHARGRVHLQHLPSPLLHPQV